MAKYRISNEFSFHTMYYETSCAFYIPEPLARGYETHNEFHNTSYWMKIHLRFFLSHELTRNKQIRRLNRLFPIIRDGWHRALLRCDKKFAWCIVITMRRISHFTIVEIKNTKKSMFWYNNKKKMRCLMTCVHSQTRSDILPTRKSYFSHAQIFM